MQFGRSMHEVYAEQADLSFMSHTVHYKTEKVTNKCTGIVYLFLKFIYLFIYLSHPRVSTIS
jgi:hypothetical protein